MASKLTAGRAVLEARPSQVCDPASKIPSLIQLALLHTHKSARDQVCSHVNLPSKRKFWSEKGVIWFTGFSFSLQNNWLAFLFLYISPLGVRIVCPSSKHPFTSGYANQNFEPTQLRSRPREMVSPLRYSHGVGFCQGASLSSLFAFLKVQNGMIGKIKGNAC